MERPVGLMMKAEDDAITDPTKGERSLRQLDVMNHLCRCEISGEMANGCEIRGKHIMSQ
jgi:hypothetical protein